MFLFPLLKLKEINLITLWSEKPCLFDVTLSDYSHRLKKDCVSINSCLRPQFSIVPPFRTLPGVAKLRQQPTFFFSLRCRHFVCLHWFTQFSKVTRWTPRSRLKSHIVAGEKNRQVFPQRSNSPRSARKITRCVVGLRCFSKANVLCFLKEWIKFA